MSQYFDETLKTYFDKLTNSPVNPNSLADHVSVLSEKAKNLISYVGSTKWKESGKDAVVNTILPKFNSKTTIFINNINNNLIPAATKAKNELYPVLTELNTKESELNSLEQRISAKGTDEETLRAKYNSLSQEMSTLSSKAKGIVEEIKKLNNLVNLDGTKDVSDVPTPAAAQETKVVAASTPQPITITEDDELIYVPFVPTDDTVISKKKKTIKKRSIYGERYVAEFLAAKRKSQNNKYNMGEFSPVSIEDEKLNPKLNNKITTWNTLGSDWIVANTTFAVKDYANYAYQKGIRQDSNAGRYGDLCLAFSYVHASNMMTGSTADNAESAFNWKYSGNFKDYFSNNKQQTLTTIYNEIVAGKPVVLQVNGNKEGTHRHFVTVVGFNKNVTSGESIKESDLLIYDSWDGKIETMNTSSSRFMTTGAQTGKTYSGYYLRLLK